MADLSHPFKGNNENAAILKPTCIRFREVLVLTTYYAITAVCMTHGQKQCNDLRDWLI